MSYIILRLRTDLRESEPHWERPWRPPIEAIKPPIEAIKPPLAPVKSSGQPEDKPPKKKKVSRPPEKREPSRLALELAVIAVPVVLAVALTWYWSTH